MASAVVLLPKSRCPLTGPEDGPSRPPRNGIARYRDGYGSTRYVLFEEWEPVAGLQVMSADGQEAQISNVYVVPERRRLGLATRLLARAREDFRVVRHADDLTDEGRAWAASDGHVVAMLLVAGTLAAVGGPAAALLAVLPGLLEG